MKKDKISKEELKSKNLRLEKFVEVDDDWYGNYIGNKIRVGIALVWRPNINSYFVRISAFGNDDFGMIRDFECHYECEQCILQNNCNCICKDKKQHYQNFLNIYNYVLENIYNKIPEITNQQWFLDNGFDYF